MTRLSHFARLILSVLFILSACLQGIRPASAQEGGVRTAHHPHTGKVSFIGAAPGRSIDVPAARATGMTQRDRALAMVQRYASDLGLTVASRELEVHTARAERGREITRFQQVHQGIPVMAGELVVNAQGGGIVSINGEIAPDLALDVQPSITAELARQAALQAMKKKYQGQTAEFTTSDPELWIYDSRLLQPDGLPAALVWRMDVRSADGSAPINELVLIDAQRGNVRLNFNQIDTSWSVGVGSQRAPAEAQPIPAEAVDVVRANRGPLTPPMVEPPALAGTGTGDRYVGTTGVNTGDCTSSAAPCLTINYAIGQANAGETIYIAEGTYTGSPMDYGVVLLQQSAHLSGGWDAAFETQAGYSTLDGQDVIRGAYIAGSGTSSMDRFIIQNGRTNYSGGGLGVYGGTLTLSHSVVRDNYADSGGGIYLAGATLSLENVTIRGNTAQGHSGGGIDAGSGILNLNHTTIVDNTTTARGGGFYYYGTSIAVQNSIIANNIAPATESSDCYRNSGSPGNFYLLNHSLLESASNCYAPAGSGNLTGVDPELAYAASGGYYIPAPTSPVLDAADGVTCLADDQRGVARPQGGGCDMGSYEAGAGSGPPASMQVFQGDGQRSIAPNPFLTPLAVYVQDADGNPVSGAAVTFTAPSAGASATFGGTPSHESTAYTSSTGVATAAALEPNSILGEYEVTASLPPLSATFSLENGAFFVAPAGDDLNSCKTPSVPCATINGALSKSIGGDHVLVAAGTYTDASAAAVADVTQSTYISGGWDPGFTTQSGRTTLDGQDVRLGIQLSAAITAAIRNLEVRRGLGMEGGGIKNRADLTLEDITVRDSRAHNVGGGIWHGEGQLTAENITVGNNLAAFDGGGIMIDSGSAAINNSTISQNLVTSSSGATYGGGVSNPGGHAVLVRNTIIAGNTAEWSPDCRGDITSGGHNLIGYSSGCVLSAASGDLVGEPSSALDARLGDLADHGGPGLTYALLAGSPAIDAGDPATCAAADERGISRPVGSACDIGAYEGSEPQAAGPTVRTYTAAHSTIVPGTLLCDQTQPSCTGGTNLDADFAHQYALGSDLFYRSRFGRNGIAGNNMPLVSTVQYGVQYDNALWTGAQMVYGDAQGYAHADDIVGHELTHGVTQYESNLFYYFQSGAINESFSDVFGELYDQSNGAGNDGDGVKWLIGENISGAGAVRSMSHPPAYGGIPAGIDPAHPTAGDPDRVTSSNYYIGVEDNGGVHENSGVNNKAAYLLVDGGDFNGETVSPIGAEKTLAVYYEAQVHFLTSGSDYGDLYYLLYQACQNLVGGAAGITAPDCAQVQNAVDAVDMDAQPTGAPDYSPDAAVCAGGLVPSNLFYDTLESGAGNWSLPTQRWQYDSPYDPWAHSGLHYLYADDYPAGVSDVSVTMSSNVGLPANAFLHFAHAYYFEHYADDPNWYDGGVLEYSTNNGANWQPTDALPTVNGYDGSIVTGYGNPLAGRQAFVGLSNGYITSRVDLSSLSGQNVRFRWRMGLDDWGVGWGWWLDDVRVYTCVPKPISVSGNAGIAGAVLSYDNGGPKSVTADPDGDYAFTVSTHWSGVVTPAKDGYLFYPSSRSYTDVIADQLNQDYAAEKQAVTRFAPEAGVTSCRRPQVGVVLNLSAPMRTASGGFNPATVTLKLDNVNVTGQAQIRTTLTSPASRATILYQPPSDLALGPHQAQFTYPGASGPLTTSWAFTAANMACGSALTTSPMVPSPSAEAQQHALPAWTLTSQQSTDSAGGMESTEPSAPAGQAPVIDEAESPSVATTEVQASPNSIAAQPTISSPPGSPSRQPYRRAAPWHD